MFPVEVSCPRCGCSLLDSTHPIEGFASIHVIAQHGRKTGDIWLSALYGSFKGHQEVNVPRGTEVDVRCPECGEILSDGPSCMACEARTVILEMPNGGMVRFCSRYGCRKHAIAFGDLGKVVVASIMNRYIVSVYDSDLIPAAIETLVNYEISAVPVIRDDESLVGLLTEDRILELIYPQSFCKAAEKSKKNPDPDAWPRLLCGDAALKKPITVSPDTSLLDAGGIMMKNKIKILLVVKESVLVGVLSKGDLFRALLREKIG